jgi:hypothetical protein
MSYYILYISSHVNFLGSFVPLFYFFISKIIQLIEQYKINKKQKRKQKGWTKNATIVMKYCWNGIISPTAVIRCVLRVIGLIQASAYYVRSTVNID